MIYTPGTIIKPTRKRIRIQYYEEIMPGQTIHMVTDGRSVADAMAETPIVREGNRTYIVRMV